MSAPDHIKTVAEEILKALQPAIEQALMDAEERGAEQVRSTIAQALAPTGKFPGITIPPITGGFARFAAQGLANGTAPEDSGKAQRGSVPEAIQAVLTEKPGLLIGDLCDLVTRKNPNISAKSVRNTVQRQLDKLFERPGRQGSYTWYVKGQAPPKMRLAV